MSIVARAASMLRPRAAVQKIGPIGIDIALEEVHFVQLEFDSSQSVVVRARVSLPFDGTRGELLTKPHYFRSLIKTALDAGPFYGRKAVVALPPGMFRTVSINYRSAGTGQQEAAAILRVMQDRLDGDLGNYVLDYMPVKSHSKSDERLAMVAVSEHKPVVALLELARKAGLDVTALEIGPVAISRLVRVLSTDSGSRNVLVINSGRKVSYLTLISGDDLLFDQEVAIGENSLIQQVCDTLDMPEDMARDLVSRTGVDASAERDPLSASTDDNGILDTLAEILKPQFLRLVDEIKRAFLYAAAETRGGAVSQVYLLGSIARWPGADRLLSRLIGVNVAEIPDPLALFQSEKSMNGTSHRIPAPEIAVATGAALRGMKVHG